MRLQLASVEAGNGHCPFCLKLNDYLINLPDVKKHNYELTKYSDSAFNYKKYNKPLRKEK